MEDQFVLTPYLLDEPMPQLESMSGPEWVIHHHKLPESAQGKRISALHRLLAAEVGRSLEAGQRPVSIAGDCCAAIGVAAGLERAGVEALTVWFDAHGDFNTWETSPSGFLGGMPLAMLVGRGEQTLLEAVRLEPLPESQILLTDARDLDAGEAEALGNSKVVHLKRVSDLLRYALPDIPLHVHFDTDVLDPEVAPAMSYPAAGGPAEAELAQVFRSLAQTGNVTAVSMSTWNPAMDADGETQRVCMALLNSLLER